MNGLDADGDVIQYHFRLDQVSTFDSPLLMDSPTIPEGEGGMTSWTSPRTLNFGLWYWQVWVDDGVEESTRVHGQFVITPPQPDASVTPADAGAPDRDGGTVIPPADDAGCSCAVPGQNGPPRTLGGALLLLMVCLLRRRP
jgi:MYXO-CTERM domain-containing protein